MKQRIFDSLVQKDSLLKGLSDDRKYRVTGEDGTVYLLRLSPSEQAAKKEALFCLMEQVAGLGVPMCVPLERGLQGEDFYMLLSWVEGEDLEDAMPLLTETEQYVLGLQAGESLRKIHSVPAPQTLPDWQERYLGQNAGRVAAGVACGEEIPGVEKLHQFFTENKKLLKNRPQCFHHGDFHTGNLMLTKANTLAVVDWEPLDYDNFGDPWEEFNRLGLTKLSPYFATGLLRGYFGGEPPLLFWRLLAFYLAAGALMLVSWAHHLAPEELPYARSHVEEVLDWYQGFENLVPNWYQADFLLQYIDGIPYKMKAPFDFSFLQQYGKVFQVYDDQDSGNICFGMQDGSVRRFVKFAGAPTARASVSGEEAVKNLKKTVEIYRDLAHLSLIRLLEAGEMGGGFGAVFDWVDAACLHPMYPKSRKKFLEMAVETKLQVYREILLFHVHVAARGYVAIDFYDGSILYDFGNERTIFCDIDCYEKVPYVNKMGRLWGSSRFMSPEEFQMDAPIDEVSNVFCMGATAFVLFGDGKTKERESWTLSEALYRVAKRAVSKNRGERQQSIGDLLRDWDEALKI